MAEYQPEPEQQAFKDYGLPKDHPYTPAEDRIPAHVALRTRDEYAKLGGVLLGAADTPHAATEKPPFRTHGGDDDPVVASFMGAITAEEAAHLVGHAQPFMTRAGVTTDEGKGGRHSNGRTNNSTWLKHDATPQIWSIVQKISAIVGLDSATAEDIQVIHYTKTQEYRKHWDAYNPLNERGRNATANGGNRLVTALLYLSEVEDGGATGFINLRYECAPATGKLLVFHNCYNGTRSLHPDSNHSGLPVIEGEKW